MKKKKKKKRVKAIDVDEAHVQVHMSIFVH